MSNSVQKELSTQFPAEIRFWRDLPGAKFRIQGANIQHAASHNRKIILHEIRAHSSLARKELADITGLTTPAVFKITKDLLEQGWLMSSRVKDGSLGQPTSVLALNRDAAFTVGLNVDRDQLTFVVLDFAGGVRTRVVVPTALPSPTDVRAFFSGCLDALGREKRIPVSKIAGVGIAIPDDIARAKIGEMPDPWQHVDVSDLLGDLISCPVVRENDAASAAIGEMMFGAGLTSDSFFYLFVSVGLGGGLVINRQYVRGAHGRSGELGYLPQINPFRSSKTDMSRTLEQVVSTAGLLDVVRQATANTSDLRQVDFNDPVVDAAVEAWVAIAADLLYLPLLTILCTIDPGAIMIGGRLPKGVTEMLCFEVSKRLSLNVGIHWPQMAVRPARLLEDAAAVGAAVLAFRHTCE